MSTNITTVDATLNISHTITHMKVICNYLELNNFAHFTVDFYTADPSTTLAPNPVVTATVTIKDTYYNDWGSDDNYITTLITNNVNEIISSKNFTFENTTDTTDAAN